MIFDSLKAVQAQSFIQGLQVQVRDERNHLVVEFGLFFIKRRLKPFSSETIAPYWSSFDKVKRIRKQLTVIPVLVSRAA